MRKQPANTVAAALAAAVAASAAPIAAPKHVKLREQDMPFWADIVRSRARDEWMPADLVIAAQLARCQADIEIESAALDNEGSVIMNHRGTQVMNPRHSVLQQLAQRGLALMRSLQMVGSARGTPRADLQQGRKLQLQAESLRNEVFEDELLA